MKNRLKMTIVDSFFSATSRINPAWSLNLPTIVCGRLECQGRPSDRFELRRNVKIFWKWWKMMFLNIFGMSLLTIWSYYVRSSLDPGSRLIPLAIISLLLRCFVAKRVEYICCECRDRARSERRRSPRSRTEQRSFKIGSYFSPHADCSIVDQVDEAVIPRKENGRIG